MFSPWVFAPKENPIYLKHAPRFLMRKRIKDAVKLKAHLIETANGINEDASSLVQGYKREFQLQAFEKRDQLGGPSQYLWLIALSINLKKCA